MKKDSGNMVSIKMDSDVSTTRAIMLSWEFRLEQTHLPIELYAVEWKITGLTFWQRAKLCVGYWIWPLVALFKPEGKLFVDRLK